MLFHIWCLVRRHVSTGTMSSAADVHTDTANGAPPMTSTGPTKKLIPTVHKGTIPVLTETALQNGMENAAGQPPPYCSKPPSTNVPLHAQDKRLKTDVMFMLSVAAHEMARGVSKCCVSFSSSRDCPFLHLCFRERC